MSAEGKVRPRNSERMPNHELPEPKVSRWPVWLKYFLAAALTIIAFLLRSSLGPWIGSDRPVLIFFMIPLVISAYLGGMGPALLSSALIAVGVPYLVLPPLYSLNITRPVDVLQWVILCSCCAFISVVSGILHRSRQRAEANERLLSTTIASIGDGVITTNAKGEITFLNEEAERLTGWRSQEAIGRPLDEVYGVINRLSRTPVTDHAQNDRPFEASHSTVDGHLLVSRDGREVPVEDRLSSIRLGDGTVIGSVVVFRDRSEEKRAEQALRRSEERFRAMFEMASVGMAQADPQTGCWKQVNSKLCEITGYLPEELIGKRFSDITHSEDREKDWESFQEVIRGEASAYRLEKRYIRKDGGIAWVNVNVTVLRDATGQPFRSLAVIEDITERKRAEEELAISSRRLSRAEIISRSGNWEFDLESQRVFASDGAREIYGLLNAEWNIPDVQQIPLPEYRDQLDKALRDLIKGNRPYDIEFRVRRPDTGAIVDIHSVAEYDQYRRVVFGVIQDITERKLAESQRQEALEALSQSESLMRTITDAAQDAIVMMDPAGCISFWNPAAELIFGYSTQEAAGQPLHAFLAPGRYLEAHHGAFSVFRETGQGKVTGKTIELHACRKNGDEFPIELSLSSIRLEDGWHAVGVIRDITSRKRDEEERLQLEERLQRAEKMEALGTLAGGVAHDLNNVLGIVVGYSELLLDELDEGSPQRSEALEVLKGGLRAAAMVQDLLTLARRGVANKRVLNLNQTVMECQKSPDFAKTLSAQPNILVKNQLEPHLLNVLGSSVHLEKSFLNLIANATEAMPNGGTLTIKTANCYLDKPISGYDEVREGDYVVLSISDTGEGISSADLKRIFEPFYTKKVMGRSGTGLGLAVVWGTVKDHLGYVNVESEEEQGTTFTFYFPVSREEAIPDQVPVSVAEYLGNGESILVVDDIKEQRNLACSMLMKLNYTVDCVASGEEAVEFLKDHAVDLMVLDMIMDPGMDGLDTYWKALEIHPRQKAIIVSGYSETDRVAKAQALGAGAYVKKPYVLEKLGLAVRKELDRVT